MIASTSLGDQPCRLPIASSISVTELYRFESFRIYVLLRVFRTIQQPLLTVGTGTLATELGATNAD